MLKKAGIFLVLVCLSVLSGARAYAQQTLGAITGTITESSGAAVPDDIECDCIWNGIDAALEAAGFRKWLTAHTLVAEVAYRAYRQDPLWDRPGVAE